MNKRNSLALTGLLALASCNPDPSPKEKNREVIIPNGAFKGTYVVDTESIPHTVKYFGQVAGSLIKLSDDDLDGTPNRTKYTIIDTVESRRQGRVIKVNLPETQPDTFEIGLYLAVIKEAN